jgi:hypothetical protein
MSKYLDELMRNHPLESEDSDAAVDTHTLYAKNKARVQSGGAEKSLDMPIGGFPPIFLCDRDEEDSIAKTREYSTHKTAVSIKEIMKKRRDATPFVTPNI